jgi:aspartate/methionine/tyrosine aminotransferase
MFSRRVPAQSGVNALTRAVARARASGTPLIDLTVSNPTRVGVDYPSDLLRDLAAPAAHRYEPHPLGLSEARAAVARDHARRGAVVDPEHVVLTASTSEAYTWLFKLLCDPGDAVLIPRPSYPLFDHLTALEGVAVVPYDLTYHGRWDIDVHGLESAPATVRAVVVVSPNNPTGSFVDSAGLGALRRLCIERRWALVVDEVFADYLLDAINPPTDLAMDDAVLTFTLGGLSKTVGLPQVKLGWMVVGGPEADRRAALTRLELIADSFLSVSTPVQVAAADLLERGAVVRSQIQARLADNLRRLRVQCAAWPACEVLRTEGGWSAVVRVPAIRSEEQLVVDLVDARHVLVHPGFFFDFVSEAFVVVSLLPETAAFDAGISRVLEYASV